MICDIVERVNIKKVDKCLVSDLHLDPSYITMHPNAERLYCHLWHVQGPKYHNAYYVLDTLWDMLMHPRDAKQLWREMRYWLRKHNG
jgi:hypothetical protein